MKSQDAITAARDLALFVIGAGGIIHQEVTNQVKPELLAVYTVLLGIPGAIGLASLRRGAQDQAGQPESQSRSQSRSRRQERS